MATRVLSEDDSVDEEEEVEEEEVIEVGPANNRHIMRIPSIKRKDFGMSLLLSNVPMSPKFINGSFAAIFDNNNVIVEFAKELSRGDFNGQTILLSPRRRIKLKDQMRQQSLDSNYFSIKRAPGRFKQGSLDSKIDEILETSSYGSDVSGNFLRTDSVDDSEADSDDVKANVTSGVATIANGKEKPPPVDTVNGVCLTCKHCGKPVNG